MLRFAFRAAAAALVLAASSASGQDLAAQQRADIDFVRRQHLPRERAYTPETRAEAERLLADLDARTGAMSPAEFFLGLSRVNAAADNAHSLTGYADLAVAPPTRLPLVLAWFEDAGFVVLRARAPHEDLAGATVLAIEGRPARAVLDELSQYSGGPPVRRALMAPRLIHTGETMHAAGLADTPDTLTLRLRLRDGAEIERDVAYVPAAETGPGVWWPSRWWSPEPVAGDATPWATAISPDALPLYLRDAEAFNRAIPLPELNAAYLELRTNEAERDARAFVSRAEAVLRQTRAQHVIVDLRFNKGGDMRITADFFRALPQRIPGRVFVIVGRYTFSAGMASAAILLNAAGDRATLVGEDVGDRLRFWSEGESLCTPNARFCLRHTDGLFDLAQGCNGQPRCYSDNRRYNLVVVSLRPTLPAPLTWADYLAKRDPAMDAIAAALRG